MRPPAGTGTGRPRQGSAAAGLRPPPVGGKAVAAPPQGPPPPEQFPGALVGARPPLAAGRARAPVLVLEPEDPAVHAVTVPARAPAPTPSSLVPPRSAEAL